MKSIFLALFLFCGAAQACPDLAGTYRCLDQENPTENYDFQIQKNGDSFAILLGEEPLMVTPNSKAKLLGNLGGIRSSLSATCTPQSLIVQVSHVSAALGYKSVSEMTFTQTSAKTLSHKFEEKNLGAVVAGQEASPSEIRECIKTM